MVKLLTVVILCLSTLSFFSLPLPEQTCQMKVGATSCLLLEPPGHAPLSANHELSSDFGMRHHPVTKKQLLHQGLDWRAPLGTPVEAAGSGVVLEAGDKGKYGNCIIIVHDEIYQTLYAHLHSIDVVRNQQVEAGQIIGKVGNTGESTGPHLHFEVWKNGMAVNPQDYLP